MKQWWLQQSARDQKILLWGGSAAAVLLFWALAWDPIDDARAGLRQQVSEFRGTRLWLEQVEQMIARAPNSPRANNTTQIQSSLLRLVDDTVRSQGLAAAIERMEPDSPGRVRLWLRAAAFDDVVQWLEIASAEHGMTILQAQISADDEGKVNARLLVSLNDAS